jgi:hypothetical protein
MSFFSSAPKDPTEIQTKINELVTKQKDAPDVAGMLDFFTPTKSSIQKEIVNLETQKKTLAPQAAVTTGGRRRRTYKGKKSKKNKSRKSKR